MGDEWKENARSYFKQCYDCNFDAEYEFEKGKALCQVIGAAIYGEQADGVVDERDQTKFGYSEKKACHILKIQNKMYELSPTYKIRLFKMMIYMFIDDERHGPTIAFKFRGKGDKNSNKNFKYKFIDASARVYSSWMDFKKNNKLPECQVAYPQDGEFKVDANNNILVEFDESPACSVGKKFVRGTDTVAGVVGFATTAVALAGLFFPLTAPLSLGCLIAGSATGFYGATRSTAELVDRSQHEQSINLADAEARLHWMSIATAPLAIAGSVATVTTKSMAASGQVLSRTSQIMANTAIFSSFTMASVNLANNFVHLVDKAQNDELTVLDLTSFAISTVFWANSAMNLQTAEQIIKSTQRQVLQGYSDPMSKKDAKRFNKMVQETTDESVPRDSANPMKRNMYDNAKAIRSIKQIDNLDALFRELSIIEKLNKQGKEFGHKEQIEGPINFENAKQKLEEHLQHQIDEAKRDFYERLNSGLEAPTEKKKGTMEEVKMKEGTYLKQLKKNQEFVNQAEKTLKHDKDQKQIAQKPQHPKTIQIQKQEQQQEKKTTSSSSTSSHNKTNQRIRESDNLNRILRKYRNSDEESEDEEKCTCKDRELKVLFFNARSVNPENKKKAFVTKISKIKKLVENKKPDLVAIVETWLSANHSNESVKTNLGLKDYDLFRQDRRTTKDNNNAQNTKNPHAGHRGGGIMLAVKKELEDVSVRRETSEDDWDMIVNFDIVQTIRCKKCAKVEKERKYGLAVIYRRPVRFKTQSKEQFADFEERFRNKMSHLGTAWYDIFSDDFPKFYTNYAFVGDFNLPPDETRQLFDSDRIEMVKKDSNITRKSKSDIDHVLTGVTEFGNEFVDSNVRVTEDFISDHKGLIFNLTLNN